MIFLSILGFLLIAPLAFLNSFTSDDYRYHFFYNGFLPSHWHKMDHFFFEIVPSLINHWEMWNGRVFAHFFVQLLMQFPHSVSGFFISVIWVTLVWLVIFLAKVKVTLGNFLVAFSVLFIALPMMGQTVFWVSGFSNYLLMTVFQLAFLASWLKSSKNWHYVLLLFLAPFVGNSEENGGPTIFLIITIITLFSNKTVKDVIKVIGLDLMGIVGFSMSVFSPGSRHRAAQGISEILSSQHLYAWFQWVKNNTFVVLLLIALLGLAHVIFVSRAKTLLNQDATRIAILGAFINVMLMFMSVDLPDRTSFSAVTFLSIIVIQLYNDIKNTRVGFALGASLFFVFVVSLSLAVTNVYGSAIINWENERTVINAKNNNETEIVILKNPSAIDWGIKKLGERYNSNFKTANLSSNPRAWYNTWYARYYGVENVKLK